MERFLKDKKTEELKPVYLIESRSEKIIDEKLKQVKNFFKEKIGAESDMKFFDENEEVETGELFNFLSTPSFFSIKKVLMIKNIDKIPKDLLSVITDFIKNNPGLKDNVIIFLSCTDSRKITTLLSEIKKTGEIIKIDKPVSDDLKKRLLEKNEFNKVRFTPNAARLFLDNIGEDPVLFETEYEKILTNIYFDKAKIVNEEKIKILVSRSTESTIFELIDQVGKKNFPGAVLIIPDLMPDSETGDKAVVMALATNLYRMFKAMLYLKADKGKTDGAASYLQKKIKASPYFLNMLIKKYQGFTKNYSYEEIIRVISRLNEFDISLKSKSNFPARTFLNNLILTIQLAGNQTY